MNLSIRISAGDWLYRLPGFRESLWDRRQHVSFLFIAGRAPERLIGVWSIRVESERSAPATAQWTTEPTLCPCEIPVEVSFVASFVLRPRALCEFGGHPG